MGYKMGNNKAIIDKTEIFDPTKKDSRKLFIDYSPFYSFGGVFPRGNTTPE